MQWIHEFQLFLFDFDGLLVNTEELQFAAYVEMLKRRGISLGWSFEEYCLVAHKDALGLRDRIYVSFPELKAQEPEWDVLRDEKNGIYQEMLKMTQVQLMPGVETVLRALEKENRKRCVVTHSKEEQIRAIRKSLPVLDSIPVWITREHYKNPKPDPECYLKAIEMLAAPGDKVIGFEDSLRGWTALKGAGAEAVLIAPSRPNQIKNINYFKSFHKLTKFIK